MGYNKQRKSKESENKQRDKNRRVERIFHENVRRSREKSKDVPLVGKKRRKEEEEEEEEEISREKISV